MAAVLALLIGLVAGLRTMTAPAAASRAAALGWIDLSTGPLAVLGYRWTPLILTTLALLELVGDKLPATPSRKVPMQFGTRIVSGMLAGAALGGAAGSLALGAVAGLAGAILGTLGGAALRARLAGAQGRDLPAALTEDALAVCGALLIVMAAR